MSGNNQDVQAPFIANSKFAHELAKILETQLEIPACDHKNMIVAALDAFSRRRSLVTRYYQLVNQIEKDAVTSSTTSETDQNLNEVITKQTGERDFISDLLLSMTETLMSEVGSLGDEKARIAYDLIEMY